MSEADDIEDKEVEEFLEFLKVSNKVCKKKGKQYEFECPICKGKARALKSNYNGHLHAKCEKCNINIIE